MKLIKMTDEHYVIVDDLEITQACYVYKNHENVHGRGIFYLPPDTDFVAFNKEAKDVSVITHSTQPLEPVVIDISPVGTPIIEYEYDKVKQLSLQEVKELIGEVDVEKKAEKYTSHDMFWYKQGYNQAIEDNKEKKYTEEDILDAWELGASVGLPLTRNKKETLFKALQPKTEWKVEIVDNKINIK